MDSLVIVKDWITKQRVEGARVQLIPEQGAPQEMFTDANGEANFGVVMSGLYRVTVEHRDFNSGTVSAELPTTVQIELLPWWAVGLGLIVGSCVVVVVGAKAVHWW